MLPDFSLIQKHIPHNRDIRILPVADVHLGAAEHMESEWREFRMRVLEDPDAYLILAGDLINNSTRSSVSNVFEETLRPREQKRLMTEMLMPLRDRILCAVPGNHENRSEKDADDNPMYDIMCKMDLEDLYRDSTAFLKIQMGDVKGNGANNPTYVFVTTHGAGGGMTTGGAVNRAERFGMTIDGCDALIVGHTHKTFNTPPFKIKIDTHNNRVSLRPFHVINCTSWMNYAGYAMRHMMPPTGYMPQTIQLSGSRKNIQIITG